MPRRLGKRLSDLADAVAVAAVNIASLIVVCSAERVAQVSPKTANVRQPPQFVRHQSAPRWLCFEESFVKHGIGGDGGDDNEFVRVSATEFIVA